MQTETTDGLTLNASASLLGIHPFSLLARVQTDEIQTQRARWGELLIPGSELERLSPESNRQVESPKHLALIDERLGIEKTTGHLKCRGERPARFTVPAYAGQFGASEAQSYRAAYGAIAPEMEETAKLKGQLDDSGKVVAAPEKEIGGWRVRSTLLNLGTSDVLLCERGPRDWAVIERFQADSPFARKQGQNHTLLEGKDAASLIEAFQSNARHTLAYLASNAVATAQQVVWEQFPTERAGEVVAAISERCRLAVAPIQAMSQNQQPRQATGRGVHI